MRLNWEEVADKVAKRDERRAVFESHVKSHIMNIESLVKHSLDANTNIKDIVTKDVQEVNKLVDAVKEGQHSQTIVTNRLNAIFNHLQVSNHFLLMFPLIKTFDSMKLSISTIFSLF